MSGIPTWARRGQKVVCVTGAGHWTVIDLDERGQNVPFPQIGLIYTISRVDLTGGWVGLELAELAEDCWFGYRGFAPVVEGDIEVEAELFRQFKPLVDRRGEVGEIVGGAG